MLTELRIRNVAIIEAVTLPLAPGFNVLSGETGAGKSIIVGALGLLLGERGSADVVRTGADRAVVEGVFDATGLPEVPAQLDARGIDVENGLVVLRREVSAAGKGRAWINGTTVTAGVLASIGRLLVNLHGQHESQSLLHEESQRAVLDGFGGAIEAARAVREAHATLVALREEVAALSARRDAALRRADYLRHVVRELEEAKLTTGEEEKLTDESRRLAHAEDLRAHVAQVREAMEAGDAAALPRLGGARRALLAAQRLDPTTEGMLESLDAAVVSLEELARDVLAYESTLESDPQRLAAIEQRLDVYHRLTRKHGGSVEAALQTLRESKAELDVVDTADADLRALGSRVRDAEQSLRSAAAELTARRTEAARRLAAAVDRLLPALGLPDGRFTVALPPREPIAATGAEEVEFHVALNVGHDARPLARVASGGELSRVMLALKTILARLDRVPTLVFDEVDAGIGGAVALRIGDTLRRLSAERQVFVITHLAQIAARAHHHIVVAKGPREGVTTADIRVADGESRIAELARMLGGDPEREVSRAHARELLAAAEATAGTAASGSASAPRNGGPRRRASTPKRRP
ncbi:MAG TPA: DNA repair protein RecN [Gemmatimonadaceae bacterium]|nr:DNA repair protein RecN [Gemmatimonadaceae bacterium]